MSYQNGRIRLNVGGKIFETTATTLASAGRDSLLGALLDDDWNLKHHEPDGYFLDRNPSCFAVLLELLRTGHLHIPSILPEKQLYGEASYYGLLGHVRAAKWGAFDGNRLNISASVKGRAPGDGIAIRAGPDGGCCVAHGSMVHIYDWMLEEHPPIHLNYQRINDAGYIDLNNIVVTACERLGCNDGGMAAFSSSTGELKYKFQVLHGDQDKSFTAGALSFSSDFKIFASCRGRSNEYGIGVWDQITGKQTGFFYETPGWSLGDADKLQWLHGSNCLMVATLFPKKDNCYISFLDFRQNAMVWSWSDCVAPRPADEKRVLDAVAMEENTSICMVDQYDDLGFLDWRSERASVRWRSSSQIMKERLSDETCYPKLAIHDGKLYSSMNSSISVFSGPDWVLTSRLGRSYGGSICDFSIGGDRLFALHSEENVFDVWETPPGPVV